jgi:hypothetical protein
MSDVEAPRATSERQSDIGNMIKPVKDRRAYRLVKLPNGMTVVLVSSSQAAMMTASGDDAQGEEAAGDDDAGAGGRGIAKRILGL